MLISIGTLRKLIKDTLNERRKNEEEDQRYFQSINTLKKLLSDNKQYFIHFTNDYKLHGINPHVDYKTPVGIYVYPLTSAENIAKVPYAAARKWIIIYECKNYDKLLIVSQYSWRDFATDALKLGFDPNEVKSQQLSTNYPASALMWCLYNGQFDVEDNIGYDGELLDKDGNVYSPERIKKNKNTAIVATKKLLSLGYIGMYDDIGGGVIHPHEPIQAFFVSSRFLNVVDVVHNPHDIVFKTWSNEKRNKHVSKQLNDEEMSNLNFDEKSDLESKKIFQSLPRYKQIALLRSQTGTLIRYIDDPTEEEQMIAIASTPFALKHIKNPTDQVKKFAEEEYKRLYNN